MFDCEWAKEAGPVPLPCPGQTGLSPKAGLTGLMGDADNHTTKTNGDSPTAVCSSSFASLMLSGSLGARILHSTATKTFQVMLVPSPSILAGCRAVVAAVGNFILISLTSHCRSVWTRLLTCWHLRVRRWLRRLQLTCWHWRVRRAALPLSPLPPASHEGIIALVEMSHSGNVLRDMCTPYWLMRHGQCQEVPRSDGGEEVGAGSSARIRAT